MFGYRLPLASFLSRKHVLVSDLPGGEGWASSFGIGGKKRLLVLLDHLRIQAKGTGCGLMGVSQPGTVSSPA